MKCYHCGQEIENDANHCMYCGAKQNNAPAVTPAEEPVAAPVEEPVFMHYDEPAAPVVMPAAEPAAPIVQPAAEPAATAFAAPVAVATAEAVAVPAGTKIIYVQGAKPALELATNRSLTKMIFLGLVTLGIYDLVIYCKMVSDLNIVASRYDGRRTMPYFAMCVLAPFTAFVLPFVWMHNICDRIKVELKRRNIEYKFGPAKFWLWNVLGSLILVGPFIFVHKLMKAMNLLCENFNQVG